MKKIIVLILSIFLLLGIIFFLKKDNKNKEVALVNSFEECVSLGFPVMESYPRQCSDGQGNLFIENIGNGLEKSDLIQVTNIIPNQLLESPFELSGSARGNWYFEGSFPIRLIDDNGIDLILTPPFVTADGEWMTTDFVPFSESFSFNNPTSDTGTLILVKDNPSGLPEHDDSLIIPVKFR